MENEQQAMHSSSVENYDVVVAGGGLAGLCAAVSSARAGSPTALINDRPVLGGNSSSEVRVVPMGAASKTAWSKETGIVEEILLGDRATNPADFYDNGTMNRTYDLRLYELACAEPNLTVLANTSVIDVVSERVEAGTESDPYQRRISAVVATQLTTTRTIEVRGTHFIDCTGDGTVGLLAGAEYRLGREAREEFGEPLAPLEADEVTMGSTICMRAIDYGKPLPYAAPKWATHYEDSSDLGVSDRIIRLPDRPECAGFWWVEIGHPYHQVRDAETIRDVLLGHVLGIWDYMKNRGPDRERLATFGLEWVGMLPGKRESRRLVGDVIVNEHHCHVDKQWPDRLTHAGWYIDVHTKGGVLNPAEPGEISHVDESYASWTHIAPFTIPLRASYSRNIANLWMSGRCLSATHVALGPVRVMATLGLHGQAVGAAASMAVASGLSPRQFSRPGGECIPELHQKLLRDDVHVYGIRNEDEDDVARHASATASSTETLCLDEDSDAWEQLHQPKGQVLFASTGRINSVAVFLRNESSEDVELTATLHELERIWDRSDGKVLHKVVVVVSGDHAGWLEVPLAAEVDPTRPVRLSLKANTAVAWAHAYQQPTGTLAQFRHHSDGGPFRKENLIYPSFQPSQTELPAFDSWNEHKWFSFATRLQPSSAPYGPENAVNGCAWPYESPNLWIADSAAQLPQHLDVAFNPPERIRSVHVSFDTDLNARYRDLPGMWRAPTCPRHWRLLGRVDGDWKVLGEEHDNYLRHRIVEIESETVSALRVEMIAGQNDSTSAESARLYEIRAYRA